MPIKIIILPTDALLYLLVILAIAFTLWARKRQHIRIAWERVYQNKIAVVSMTILSFFVVIGLLDSIHFRSALPSNGTNRIVQYQGEVKSLLDVILSPAGKNDEVTYSAPFAQHLFSKQTITLPNGKQMRLYPKLEKVSGETVAKNVVIALARALIVTLIICGLLLIIFRLRRRYQARPPMRTGRTFLLTFSIIVFIILVCSYLSQHYHILGTDKVGQDVYYQTIKSIRTGLILGTLTTLVMLPFALLLGPMAGYYGGLVDDVIQYIYTTLSSIPGVLLIAASVLALQIFINNHPELLNTIAGRADARLLALCFILGITSWTGLCRLLRGESLKLREMDYVQAARALGVRDYKIIIRHILPNVMHIVLITVVLDFSGLVLAEAVLTYVGVGVDPTTYSWGNMINSARLELARDPVIWWPLMAAFVLMFTLVLTANLFADTVRDAFDPRIQH